MTEILRQTNLPATDSFPTQAITSASRGRWGTPEYPGSLPQMIVAVQNLLENDGIGPDRIMLISDGSDGIDIIPRKPVLERMEKELGSPEPIFFLTPELQIKVVDMVTEKTHLDREVVEKIL